MVKYVKILTLAHQGKLDLQVRIPRKDIPLLKDLINKQVRVTIEDI